MTQRLWPSSTPRRYSCIVELDCASTRRRSTRSSLRARAAGGSTSAATRRSSTTSGSDSAASAVLTGSRPISRPAAVAEDLLRRSTPAPADGPRRPGTRRADRRSHDPRDRHPSLHRAGRRALRQHARRPPGQADDRSATLIEFRHGARPRHSTARASSRRSSPASAACSCGSSAGCSDTCRRSRQRRSCIELTAFDRDGETRRVRPEPAGRDEPVPVREFEIDVAEPREVVSESSRTVPSSRFRQRPRTGSGSRFPSSEPGAVVAIERPDPCPPRPRMSY